ncbi:hypothetical protein SO802_024598 [Lithocarpus litseifolius]|uniref:ADP-ribosyl cyclase/cyclic ADP-ribose hydrolase n=1 Tax=Lithocarpus litseifolius TaxID=425828 RepID=A0AAW2C9C5_9ROSI
MKRKRESLPSPSSSSTRQWKYEVFLSFRGEDTRTSFTDHLYAALKRNGIITFRDEEELEKGKSISKLFEAIEESQIAVIIFSKDYASSKWCLKELAKINECRKEIGLIVLPIFYDVEPSNVKKQTGTFEQAFIEHQKCFEVNIKEVETWRTALKEVANIKGWHLQNRPESEFIQDVVKEMEKLSSKSSSITKKFIGIESTLAELIPSYLSLENDIRMIGIYGMGGLGKTTLARVVYDKFRGEFEGSSFIANVREDSKKHGLPELQQQLLADILKDRNIRINNVYDGVFEIEKRLRCKKVLLVIDDVDRLDQLEKLAGENDWFGLGSKIIITTRDEHVLIQHRVCTRYNPNGLNNDNALKLFCLKAFQNEQPKKGYMQLSQEVVKYANGLPLALVTLGSFLVGRTINEWESALPSFKNTKGEIFDILKVSYDGLEEVQKKIFLDIACFFRYWEKNAVIHILDNCGFYARIGISILLEKSLISLKSMNDNEYLEMHDLLQEMGEKIVRSESNEKHGKQRRLWLNNDLLHVLKDNMATNAIEAIVIRFKENEFKIEEFLEVLTKMSNLRLMILDTVTLIYCGFPNVQRHLDVPNHLRHLSWDKCPTKCLSFSSQPVELVHLNLRFSRLEYLWEGVMLSKLKFLDLAHSNNLIRTPDFSSVPILEELDLSNCGQLVEIHPSIGQLSKLRHLRLCVCISLCDLPSMSAEMQSLEILELEICPKINSFLKFTGIMKKLWKLRFCSTAIKEVPPSSIKCLTALTLLDLSRNSNLKCLPKSIKCLTALTLLDLSRNSNLKCLPKSIKCLTALTLLDLSRNYNLKCLPRNIHKLSSLEKLRFSNDSKLPRLPSTVRVIEATFCYSLKLSSWSQPLSQWCPYDARDIQVEFKILFYFLQQQGLLCRKMACGTSSKREEDGSITEFQIMNPSDLVDIKGWSVFIELPLNWYNSKWIGFALWASSDFICRTSNVRAHVTALGDMSQNLWDFEPFTPLIYVKNNICLLYLFRDDWFATVGNGKCSQIMVSFEIEELEFPTYLGKCGVSLIYEQDVDEFNQQNAQSLIESFGEEVSIYKLAAFINHQKCFEDNIEKVERWKAALREVANITSWHLQNRHESEFIQHVVKEIMKKLSSKPSSITKNFIGMESTLVKFIPSYIGFENNIRMIGIYGMGDLGKTTLARTVYDEFHSHFECSNFIANVREDSKKQGLSKLQQQLLADILEDRNIRIRNVYDGVDIIKKRFCKKVLLVINDVDHLDQLEKLAGENDWFGLGSWIIITTRDEHMLIQHEVLNRYNPNGLNNDDALKLFCLKAFKNEQHKKGYMQLSQEVVKYANGLPLALVTLGSFFVGRK